MTVTETSTIALICIHRNYSSRPNPIGKTNANEFSQQQQKIQLLASKERSNSIGRGRSRSRGDEAGGSTHSFVFFSLEEACLVSVLLA